MCFAAPGGGCAADGKRVPPRGAGSARRRLPQGVQAEAPQRLGFGADVIDENGDLTPYRLVIGPMTYMLRPGFAERVRAFVAGGGVYVTTYCSGWVNEEDLCFQGGFPGPLRETAGIWDEETDALPGMTAVSMSLNLSRIMVSSSVASSSVAPSP